MTDLDNSDKELLRRAYSRIESANEIMRFLSEYFRDKYGLTPDNQITPAGQIVSVSDLQEKEKLNGSHSGENTDSDSERGGADSLPLQNMSRTIPVLHSTTDGN
jgi:hypothetical protein